MANFTASQSISTIGLCQKIRSTDNSNYGTNDNVINTNDVLYRLWTFRNVTGTIIKQYQSADGAEIFCECNISLLTLNVTVEMVIVLENKPTYRVQNGFLIPCLGI